MIGRASEIKRLEKIYCSKEAEFLVIYGRRRIGKTFLIRQFFESKKSPFFQVTGSQMGTLKKQLTHFADSLSTTFMRGVMIQTLKTWEDAFKVLTQFMDAHNTQEKITLFLDELPWLATPRSGLLEALDYYWNHHWVRNPKIILVVCGSSASWLIKNIIYNPGGLHNRCTAEIKLLPFTLAETEKFFQSRGISLKRAQILDLYMALGGVPYYLTYVEKGLTATENIQKILCDSNAPLHDEFTKLFRSLFKNAEAYKDLVRLIAGHREGVLRSDLEKKEKHVQGGGRLTAQLKQLEQTNFIASYVPWGKERGECYKVIDEFCLFWLHWLEHSKAKERLGDFWVKQTQKPSYHAWAGYAFEAICHKHIAQIVSALQIQSAESVSTWRLTGKKPILLPLEVGVERSGAQIDLLIDRTDDAITLCEIRYTSSPFVMTQACAAILKKKIEVFQAVTETKKHIFMALISANGAQENQAFHDVISRSIGVNALFEG